MRAALVLTQERAQEAGCSGSGPFAFGGAFPGVWIVEHPVEVSELGFASEAEALDALEVSGAPLSVIEVEAGSAPAFRVNHLPSEREVAMGTAPAPVAAPETGTLIRSHAEADEVAASLGFAFPTDPRPRLSQKVAAIEAVRDGGDADAALDALEADPWA